MARHLEIPLDIDLGIGKPGLGFAASALERRLEVAGLVDDLQPLAAAAVRRLDGDREAVLVGERSDFVDVDRAVRWCRAPMPLPRDRRRTREAILSPIVVMASGDGPTQIRPASMTAWAKPAFSARNP